MSSHAIEIDTVGEEIRGDEGHNVGLVNDFSRRRPMGDGAGADDVEVRLRCHDDLGGD